MSEVKPTLAKEVLRDPVSPNTWRVNFPYWVWDSSRHREYTWIISYFAVISAKGYEYKISFEKPVEKFGITFPFVVKTQSPNVKSVFIYGLDYPTRSKSNYGTSFVVSGSYFHFKSATRYKLDGEVFNVVRIFYFSPLLKNTNKFVATIPFYLKRVYMYSLNSLNAFIIPSHIISFMPKDISTITIQLSAVRSVNPVFASKNYVYFNIEGFLSNIVFRQKSNAEVVLLSTRNQNPQFSSKSLFDTQIYNTNNLTSDFLDKSLVVSDFITVKVIDPVFISNGFIEVEVDAVRSINPSFVERIKLISASITPVSGVFINRNIFTVSISNCDKTSWDRFGGEWTTCEVWKL